MLEKHERIRPQIDGYKTLRLLLFDLVATAHLYPVRPIAPGGRRRYDQRVKLASQMKLQEPVELVHL